jgi:hypothetical protein
MRRMQKDPSTLAGSHGTGLGSAKNQADHIPVGLFSQQLAATASRARVAWLATAARSTGAADRTAARYELRELRLLACRMALTASAAAAGQRVSRAASDQIAQLLAEAAP